MSSIDIFIREFVTRGGYKVAIQGLWTTIIIAVLGLVIGIAIGTLLAIIKVFPKYSRTAKILDKVASVYIGFFRGTPMIVQLLLGNFVLLPALGLNLNGVAVAIIIFGLNSGAYVSEIMRSGIQSVDVGQLEAARAMGLSYTSSMRRVVVPQAIKNVLPTLGNEFIVLIKETSVVSFIAVVDITKALRSIADSTYEYLVPYVVLALIYLVLVMIISKLIKLLERRLQRSDRRS